MSLPRSARVHALRRQPRRRLAALLVLSGLLAATWSGASTAVADEGAAVPARPTGLEVTPQPGSLDVSVDWDDTNGATSYLVRWRQAGFGTSLNDGVTVTASTATITVESHGEWVVRVEACNNAGCSLGAAKRFTVESGPNRAPAVDETAERYESFIGEHTAPRGILVFKYFDGIFSDPDGDELTYTAEVTGGREELMGELEVRLNEGARPGWQYILYFEADDDSDWTALNPPVPNPVEFEVTLTATDPDGSSATVTGTFSTHWEPPPGSEGASAPVVNEDADQYAAFTGSHNAPRGAIVLKSFDGIFSDPDGDELTYTASVPDDHAGLVEELRVRESESLLSFQYDGDDDWNAHSPAPPDPLTTEITLTATDPDGLSASLTGRFHTDWESHPVLRFVDAYVIIYETLEPPGQQGETPQDSAGLILGFDQDLQTSPVPAAGQFTVKVFNNEDDSAAGTIAVDSVDIKDRRVVLELASVPETGQYFTLDYTHDDEKPIKRAAQGGDSAPGFTGQSVLMLFATSEAPPSRAFAVIEGGGTPAALVSNVGQTSSGTASLPASTQMQAFTTGPHVSGYTLSSIEVNQADADGGEKVWLLSGVPDSSNSLNSRRIATLTPPNPFIDGINKFTAPANTTLSANTQYWVVVRNHDDGNVRITDSSAEDSGAAAGWSIADSRRTAGANDEQSGPWAPAASAVMIRINGYANPLVSNTGHTDASSFSVNSHDHAQAFTTGSHPAGYKLTAVNIDLLWGTGTDPTFNVYICPESGGLPSASCSGPLTNPTTPATGINVFTAPGAGIDLKADTIYFVVWDTETAVSQTILKELRATDSGAEDSGAAAGWSIADTVSSRALGSITWQAHSTHAVQIAIAGYAMIDYDRDDDGLIEISTADQVNAIRWDTDGDGSVATNRTSYANAFHHAAPQMGCPESGCTGYEIGTGAAGEPAIAINMAVAPYNVSPGWVPIPEFTATLDGNGNTIEGLARFGGSHSDIGLFHTIGTAGVVRNLGVIVTRLDGNTNMGALAGTNKGLVLASYSTVPSGTFGTSDQFTSVNRMGGLVGWNTASGRIHASYSTLSISADASSATATSVGGLVGENHGTIVASYAWGGVNAVANPHAAPYSGFGGLVGRNHGRIHASYAIGGGFVHTNSTHVGGLVGAAEAGSSVTDSYWDTQTSGRSTSAGGTGRTTAQLKAPTGYTGIYANWNADVNRDGLGDDPWIFGTAAAYPTLRVPLRPVFVTAGLCREDIELRSWDDLHYHRYKWSTGSRGAAGEGCDSRSHPGHHARYYTFTLDAASRVRLHAEGRKPARLFLREGRNYAGDALHQGFVYSVPTSSRIDELLPAGTYTLEVTTASPGVTGDHWLWTGTVTSLPPTASQAGGSNIWQATLTVANPNNQPGCDNRRPGHQCTVAALNPNTFVHEGTTYTVKWIIQGTNRLFFTLDRAYPQGSEDWTLNVNGHEFRLGDAEINPFNNADLGEARWQGSSANTGLTVGATAQVSLSGPGGCSRPIDRGQTHAARWDPDCASVSNPGSHAAFYTYTPDRNRGTTLTLTSPDAEASLYLWEGDKLVSESHSSGQTHAQLYHLLTAGRTYIIEVTSQEPAPNGRYLLAMSGDFNPEGAAAPASCRETLTVESGRFGASGGGRFEWPCHSVERPGAYARYYIFTLTEERDVRVELSSSQVASAHMYLRAGTKGSGTHMGESHDPGPGPVDARMDGRLAAGTYTVEVVATTPGRGGDISLAIKEAPAPWTPPAECRTDLSLTLNTNGLWRGGQYAEPCNSAARPGSHSRWYTFTINQRATLNMSLFAHDADAYLYLRAGETYSGLFIAENDNVRPWPGWEAPTAYGFYDSQLITERLDPGTYTIEVTTRSAGETGGFSLGVSART